MDELQWQLLEDRTQLDGVRVRGGEIKQGDRVRLLPRRGGDIFDLALTGQVAIVEAVEQDYENKIHLAVVLEDDPGRDLGMMRQPGHRFFFAPEEVEPFSEATGQKPAHEQGRSDAALRNGRASVTLKRPRILVAGIGNIFHGDDAFGSEVARRLLSRTLPDEVRIVDYGIRGLDLAYALMDGYDVTILVDATPRGEGEPGTLYTIEPDLSELDEENERGAMIETHGMNPLSVLRLVKSMGGEFKRILLVGCEPEPPGADEERMGLSEPVAAAVGEAASVVESLVREILAESRGAAV